MHWTKIWANIKDRLSKKSYDQIIHRDFGKRTIDYGIIKGSETVVLIKTGLEGTVLGYKNKYVNLANNLHKKYGFTVICATTPTDPFYTEDPIPDALEVIKNLGLNKVIIYFMGHSCGALVGALFAYKYHEIKRLLLINAPLMVDTLLIEKAMKQFKGERAVFVYGEYDRSMHYINMLSYIKNEKVSRVVVPKANHEFKGKLKEFNSLFEKYLLN